MNAQANHLQHGDQRWHGIDINNRWDVLLGLKVPFGQLTDSKLKKHHALVLAFHHRLAVAGSLVPQVGLQHDD